MPTPSTHTPQSPFVSPPFQNPTDEIHLMCVQFGCHIQAKTSACLDFLSTGIPRKIFQMQALIEQHAKILALLTKTIVGTLGNFPDKDAVFCQQPNTTS